MAKATGLVHHFDRGSERERLARFPAAADRNCRCAQGHQPLHLRSAGGARYTRRNRQSGYVMEYDAVILLREGWNLSSSGPHHGPDADGLRQMGRSRGKLDCRACRSRWASLSICTTSLPPATSSLRGTRMALRLGHRTILSVRCLRRRTRPIGSLTVRRSEVRPLHRQGRSSWLPPSPIRRVIAN